MKTIFVVCQHGDEKIPFEVINKSFKGRINFLVANQEAFDKNIRFVESDLNRSFPGKRKGTLEEKNALKLVKYLKKYDVVLDFHTTSAYSPLFIITTKITNKHLDLISKLNVKKVVYMRKNISSGRSLIDHVELGLSLEIGNSKMDRPKRKIKIFIEDYLDGKSYGRKEYYEVFDVLKRKYREEKLAKIVKAFILVKRGQLISTKEVHKRYAELDFYPVLPGEKSYKDILCLMAKKIDPKLYLKGGDENGKSKR